MEIGCPVKPLDNPALKIRGNQQGQLGVLLQAISNSAAS